MVTGGIKVDPGARLNSDMPEASGGSGGASGTTDEPIGSEDCNRGGFNPHRIVLGAGGLHNPSSARKIHFLIALSLLIAISHARGIEPDDDSLEE